jgi:hypothetical protein
MSSENDRRDRHVILQKENYSEWVNHLEFYLVEKGQWEVVEGTAPPDRNRERVVWAKIGQTVHSSHYYLVQAAKVAAEKAAAGASAREDVKESKSGNMAYLAFKSLKD